jgi:hypothetical protein
LSTRKIEMTSTKKQARIAGLLYLLASVPAVFAWVYVPSKLIVTGDATATANHVRASETLLRLSIGSELIGPDHFHFCGSGSLPIVQAG